MKNWMKKVTAVVMALTVALTTILFASPDIMVVQAASGDVYINPYSDDLVLTYKPGDSYVGYWTTISIMGCNKKGEIKKLKSSNKNVKVQARDGYIYVTFGKKSLKTTITCTVKGVKLKTTLTVKKYSNPVTAFKIGKKNFVSKFKANDSFTQKSAFKNQKLSIRVKKGWKISSVYVDNGKGKTKSWTVNNTKFDKKISLTAKYSDINVYLYNTKTGVSECLTLYRSSY